MRLFTYIGNGENNVTFLHDKGYSLPITQNLDTFCGKTMLIGIRFWGLLRGYKNYRTANVFRWRCGGYEIMFLGILY